MRGPFSLSREGVLLDKGRRGNISPAANPLETKEERMKDLVAVDPATGVQVNCGTITKKRLVGDIPVWLTFDEGQRMWWIVWKEDRLRKIGYVEARREVCWETFFKMTTRDLAKFKPS